MVGAFANAGTAAFPVWDKASMAASEVAKTVPAHRPRRVDKIAWSKHSMVGTVRGDFAHRSQALPERAFVDPTIDAAVPRGDGCVAREWDIGCVVAGRH
jgi:hypothetical protein